MKSLHSHIQEKLLINKDFNEHKYKPSNISDLYEHLIDVFKKNGPGTRLKPIDLNYIDISDLDSLSVLFKSIVENGYIIKYIDISEWDVSNIISFDSMFYDCKDLISVGDLCNWEINTNEEISMQEMFYNCRKLTYIGNLSKWNVSNVLNFKRMFSHCRKLTNEHVGDIFKCWKISPNAICMSAIWDCGIT